MTQPRNKRGQSLVAQSHLLTAGRSCWSWARAGLRSCRRAAGRVAAGTRRSTQRRSRAPAGRRGPRTLTSPRPRFCRRRAPAAAAPGAARQRRAADAAARASRPAGDDRSTQIAGRIGPSPRERKERRGGNLEGSRRDGDRVGERGASETEGRGVPNFYTREIAMAH
jgi:hypothetical protein